jgi:hypothetical protein
MGAEMLEEAAAAEGSEEAEAGEATKIEQAKIEDYN